MMNTFLLFRNKIKQLKINKYSRPSLIRTPVNSIFRFYPYTAEKQSQSYQCKHIPINPEFP